MFLLPLPALSRPLLTALICGALLAAPAAASAQGGGQAPAYTPPKKTISKDGNGGRYLLAGDWYFRLDTQDQGLTLGFQNQTTLDGWSRVSVPNAWNATDVSEASQRGSVGWYRKDFQPPHAARSVSWILRFESVHYRATVFLNGRQIGTHEGGYIPFEIPASGLTRGTNRLVVRVDSRRRGDDLPPGRSFAPGRPGGGWWNYGGILREVYLRKVDRMDLEQLLARPILPCRRCAASVLLRATLHNYSRHQKVKLLVTVGGRRARFHAVKVPGRRTREATASVKLDHPHLWEPGHPYLYPVKAVAMIGHRIVGSYRAHVGIRSLRVDDRGVFLLNGKRFHLRGASVHEDNPAAGAAMSPGQRAFNFKLLRQLGANITRAHYPLHPDFLEAADRAGILVWEQIPVYQVSTDVLRKTSFRKKALRYLGDTIERDQNHPSVFAWSIANELSANVKIGQRKYIQEAVGLIRQLDPTRLAAMDVSGNPSAEPADTFTSLDAIGTNAYYGWYRGPNGQTEDRGLLGPYLDQMHEFYPTQALFVTEFGAEANRNGPASEKGTYAFQQELLRYDIRTFDKLPFLNGAILWLLRDFKVTPDWEGGNPRPSPPYNMKGVLDHFGRKKPAFDTVARLYRAAKR